MALSVSVSKCPHSLSPPQLFARPVPIDIADTRVILEAHSSP